MNTINYIKRLELLISDGEQLRDSMRQSSSAKDATIRRQAGELEHIRQLNELLRERRSRISKKLNETKIALSRLEKRKKLDDRNDIFFAAIKAEAIKMGIWSLLRDAALQQQEKS